MPRTTVIGSERVLISQPDGTLAAMPACVVIKGNRIDTVVTVLPGQVAAETKSLARKVSGKAYFVGDNLVSPAFVNAHTHLAMSFFRGFTLGESTRKNMIEDLFFHVESRLTEDDVESFTRMGAYECLLNGVGFVWDHYYFGKATAKALESVGLAGVVAPTLQDLSGPGTKWLERQWDETREISESEDFASAGVFAAYGPHATDTVSPDLWRRIVKESSKNSLPIHVHLAQSKEEYVKVFSREGKSPVRYLKDLGVFENDIRSLLVHGIFIPKEELALLNSKNKVLVFCPFSQLIFQFPASVLEWENAGVRWTVATDCVASNDSMNVQKELRYVGGLANMGVTYSPEHQRFLCEGGVHAAQSVGEARARVQDLSMRFSNSKFLLTKIWNTTESLHPKVRVGRLSAGSLANLVVWDNSHASLWPTTQELRGLAMGDTVGAIQNMMVAGKWIGKDGNYSNSIVKSAEYCEAKKDAEMRLQELQKRL